MSRLQCYKDREGISMLQQFYREKQKHITLKSVLQPRNSPLQILSREDPTLSNSSNIPKRNWDTINPSPPTQRGLEAIATFSCSIWQGKKILKEQSTGKDNILGFNSVISAKEWSTLLHYLKTLTLAARAGYK